MIRFNILPAPMPPALVFDSPDDVRVLVVHLNDALLERRLDQYPLVMPFYLPDNADPNAARLAAEALGAEQAFPIELTP